MRQLPAWQVNVPNVNNLVKPIGNALAFYRESMDKQVQHNALQDDRDRQHEFRQSQAAQRQANSDRSFGLQQQRFDANRAYQNQQIGLQQRKYTDEQKQQRLSQAGRLASHIKGIADPAQKEALYGQFMAADPDLARTLGSMPMDQGLDWVMAKSGVGSISPVDQAKIQKLRAQTEKIKAGGQTGFPDFGASGLDADGNLILAQYRNDLEGSPYATPNMPNGATNDTPKPRAMNPADVPGVVVSPQSGKSDQFATREMQAQKSYKGASPEDQERLRRHIATQRLWTNINGKAPAGFTYAPDGTLLDLKDKPPLDLKVALPRAKQALSLLDNAEKTLTGGTFGSYQATRTPLMQLNAWDVGQAAQDVKMAAMQIVYLLSGKQTSASEMREFTKTYVPEPSDSAHRIKQKISRVRNMLQSVVDGVESGQTYDEAFASAHGSIFDKPDDPDAEKNRLYNKYGLE
ncbi:MAG: hypothetical protein RIC14_00070 [Filomicrobium sp.]